MPRKRSKPIAEHIEATSPETPAAENEAPPAPDTEVSHVEEVANRRQHGDPKEGVTRNQSELNPRPHHLVLLTEEKDGPYVRMWRERPSREHGIREHASAIMFSEEPPTAVKAKLSTDGWEYNTRDKVWWKSLEPNVNAEDYKAHKLFVEIANEMRAANGCKPIMGLGHGAG